MGRRTHVEAGQVYRAKGLRGFKYVRVEQVRGLSSDMPYAILRELLPSGRYATGTTRNGLPRSAAWVSQLTWNGREWALPGGYELAELDSAEEEAA